MNHRQPVLVTGASGFIGRNLCRHLLAAGESLRRFSRSAAQPHANPKANNEDTHATTAANGTSAPSNGTPADDPSTIHTHAEDSPPSPAASDTPWRGDILDPAALAAACEGVGAIFHLAGVADTTDSHNPRALQTNLQGTRNLLAAARAAGVSRLVFISSALAAELDHGNAAAAGVGDYARGKWEAERLVLEANGRQGLLTTVLRPAPVYGPGMGGGIARMIRLIQARRLPPLPKLEHGFSLTGVDDLCRAAILASKSLLAPGQCWLLTDLQRYTANAVEQAVYEALGREKPGWRTPAVVFFAAAAILQLGRLAGWKKAETGLRTWRNLTSERTWPAQDIYEELNFRPADVLYARLPEIIRELSRENPPLREQP